MVISSAFYMQGLQSRICLASLVLSVLSRFPQIHWATAECEWNIGGESSPSSFNFSNEAYIKKFLVFMIFLEVGAQIFFRQKKR